jgi:hypothetical protein
MTLVFFVVLLGSAAACGPQPVSPTPTQTLTMTPVPATLASPMEPVLRPTLPPTWTPTSTYTPRPPTVTPSPTLTPSITPTLSDADRCAAFLAFSHPADGAQLPLSAYHAVTFIWQYPLPGETVTLRIVRAGSDLDRLLTMPGPQTVVATVPFNALYGPGVYHWQWGPDGPDGQPLAICMVSGTFTIPLRAREDWHWPPPPDLFPDEAAPGRAEPPAG